MPPSAADKDAERRAAELEPGGTQPGSGAPDGGLLVELNALLGRGTRYVGKLHFDGRVRIEGQFNGEIRGEDVLVIGDGADIQGDIEVGVCIVTGGSVVASIRARDAIELHAPASVKGDLHAPAIFIDRGAQFDGRCTMAPLPTDTNPGLFDPPAADPALGEPPAEPPPGVPPALELTEDDPPAEPPTS